MKRRTLYGNVIEVPGQARTVRVNVRFTPEEYEELISLFNLNRYRNLSAFVRDILFTKKIITKKYITRLTDKTVRDEINGVIYRLKVIGDRYNQVVKLYNMQAKKTHRNGVPYLNTIQINARLETLMKLTEQVRDEIAMLLDVITRFILENTSL